jgi:hypothetical protein
MLILGSIIFRGFELPEQVPLGGDQTMAVHKLLGGARVIDAMGPDDRDIEWHGLFFGADALSNARAVDAMRSAGQAVPLLIDSEMRTVVVKSFKWDYQRPYQIPYSIACVVSSTPFLGLGPSSLDDLVTVDLAAAGALISSFAGSVFS